jgi:hypothetical protein
MIPFKLPAASSNGFSIASEEEGQTLTLRFRGNGDMSSIEPLAEYLGVVHDEAMAHRINTVVADFRALDFMNSSSFKCFVQWLGKVQDLPAPERYRVVFQSNRAMHWQRRSLNALRCFAMDVVSVESQ